MAGRKDNMKKMSAGAVKDFLREYLSFWLMTIVFTAVFGVVFYLYDMKIEAVVYAFGICAAIGLTALVVSFVRFVIKRRKIMQIYDNIAITDEDFPEIRSPIEGEYIMMIEKLREINRENSTVYQNERSEALDYYTTWVHQIKTPISVMQMILQREDTEEHRELSAELFRIEQYAQMALGYVRLDSNSRDLVIKELDLDEVIRQSVRRYAGQFIRKRLVLKYGGTDIKVLSDEKWLAFIIEQFLSNAVKYTEKGFTGYNGRENSKSTGLGLYLCKKTADMLGHRIWAESDIGHGSTFFIDLHRDKLEVE